MKNVFGLITVRSESSRLPGKCFLPLGNKSVIETVIDRCKNSEIIPILCTTISTADDPLEELSKKLNIQLYRGSIKNKMKSEAKPSGNGGQKSSTIKKIPIPSVIPKNTFKKSLNKLDFLTSQTLLGEVPAWTVARFSNKHSSQNGNENRPKTIKYVPRGLHQTVIKKSRKK